jgi:hypothetical protein
MRTQTNEAMTPEQLLLTAFSGILTFLGYVLKLLWSKSEACEQWRAEKEPLITEMAERLGLAQGAAKLINSCRIDGCPFAGKLDTNTYSVERNKETKSSKK